MRKSISAKSAELPLEDFQVLLGMVLGKTPFDLVVALEALTNIAKFAASFGLKFSVKDAKKAKAVGGGDAELAALISAFAGHGGDVQAQGLIDLIPKKLLLELILSKLLEWLAAQASKK